MKYSKYFIDSTKLYILMSKNVNEYNRHSDEGVTPDMVSKNKCSMNSFQRIKNASAPRIEVIILQNAISLYMCV